jgi:outer membrane protein
LKIRNLSMVLTAVGLLFASTAHAAEVRIGYVDAVRVLEAAPQAETARAAIEKEFSGRDRELVGAQKSVKQLEDKLEKDGAVMSESERARLERDIITKRRDLKRDQDEFREDLNFRRNEEFGKIQKVIVDAIQDIAKEEKYDLVVGQGVVYFSPQVDLTEKVIGKLKAGYKGK